MSRVIHFIQQLTVKGGLLLLDLDTQHFICFQNKCDDEMSREIANKHKVSEVHLHIISLQKDC